MEQGVTVASGKNSSRSSKGSEASTGPSNPHNLATLRRFLLRGLLCTVAGLVVLTNPPRVSPATLGAVMAAAVLLAAAGLWYSLHARHYCRRLHLPTLNPWLTVIVSLVTLVLALASMVSLWAVPAYRDYTECLRGANTQTAHTRCTADLRHFLDTLGPR